MTPFLLILLLCLILGSGFFSASETALFSLSSMQLEGFRRSKDEKKRLVTKLTKSPRDLLITLIMVNVTMNIFIQNVVSSIFGDLSGWWLSVGVPLALVLTFGEFIPKSVGIANNKRLSPKIAPLLNVIQTILLPLRKALIHSTTLISRILFFFLKEEEEISTDELQHALRTSSQSGVLAEDEAELMAGYLNLQESSVRGFMRPRDEVLFYELSEPIDKLIHLFVDQECSRIPVCEEGIDEVIGIISSGSFFLQVDQLKKGEDLKPLLKKPFFVPETLSAKALLDQMYDKQESFAVVVDEYGAFAGIIVLEDLVESVVGEIFDRRDEKSRYTRSGKDVLIASGKLELMELEMLLGVTFKSENNMVTLGGFLTEQYGDIPRSGTKWTYRNVQFHILSSDEKRVRRVYIRKVPK